MARIKRNFAQRFILQLLPDLASGGPVTATVALLALSTGNLPLLILASLVARIACDSYEVTAEEREAFWCAFDYAMACPKTFIADPLVLQGEKARRRIILLMPHDPQCVSAMYSLPRCAQFRAVLFVDNGLATFSPGLRLLCRLLGFRDVIGLTNDNVNVFLETRSEDIVVLPGGFREGAACSRSTTRISCARWLYWVRKAIKYSLDLALRVVEGATQTVQQSDAAWRARHFIAGLGTSCFEQGVSADIKEMRVHGLIKEHGEMRGLGAESAAKDLQGALAREILQRFASAVEFSDVA